MSDAIGTPFRVEEMSVADAVDGVTSWVAVVNDPPWAELAATLPDPLTVIPAWDMDIQHLESLIDSVPTSATSIVGIGGGTALDTAKFLAWRTDLPLVQVPTIASVDAGFTDAVGVRDSGRVKYIGKIEPQLVAIDLTVMAQAPVRLNRAGIGDILSCHTGLFDWKLAVEMGHGVPWREDLAQLGHQLLIELDDAADDIAGCTPAGLRQLVSSYRRIGAACAQAGHSRFEEGSEHFLGYAFEFNTGAHLVHGELISMAVVAMSTLQGNDPDWARSIVSRVGARANPHDLGIERADFMAALAGLSEFVTAEGLDYCIVNALEVDEASAVAAWDAVTALPRQDA